MTTEITRLDSPIDVMFLMHQAFRELSERMEFEIARVQDGGDLSAFSAIFEFWAKRILFHATAEDTYMTGPLMDSQAARDNEAEHAELAQQAGTLVAFMEKGDAAGLEVNVKAAMSALEDQQHQELAEKLHDVEEVLKREIGERKVIARTRRHLYRKVVDLRVLEYDHFENEEAFVLPLVRERMTEAEELEVARHLLMDEESDYLRWIIDWVSSELTIGERMLLGGLEMRFNRVSTPSA